MLGIDPHSYSNFNEVYTNLVDINLEINFEKVVNDFEILKPRDRVKVYCDLLQFGLPRLQAVQLETEFERLPDEQLDQIIENLKKNNDDKERKAETDK